MPLANHNRMLDLSKTTVPERIKTLPTDERGYPIPWFVYRNSDGKPDFRVAATHKIHEAVSSSLCWICGGALQTSRAFVVGPLGVVNRVSPEPPSHRSCAVFAATTCPYLTKPNMNRNPRGLPFDREPPPGHMILDNKPSAIAVWITRRYPRMMQVDHGVLFMMHEPQEVRWYCNGKPAIRSEVLKAMSKSLAPFIEEARAEGADAQSYVMRQVERAGAYLPPKRDEAHATQNNLVVEKAAPVEGRREG